MLILALFVQAAVQAPVPCIAYSKKVGEQRELGVACGHNGARIGAVDNFASVANRATGALVVRTESDGKTRIFLITQDVAARPFIQELTRDLARSAGRYPDAGLGKVAVDISSFADTTSLTVTGDAAGRQSATFDLARYLELASRQTLTPERAVATSGEPDANGGTPPVGEEK